MWFELKQAETVLVMLAEWPIFNFLQAENAKSVSIFITLPFGPLPQETQKCITFSSEAACNMMRYAPNFRKHILSISAVTAVLDKSSGLRCRYNIASVQTQHVILNPKLLGGAEIFHGVFHNN